MTVRIEVGDCLEVLRGLPECFRVNCCVTSPPYFGLRDYGHGGQIGLEATPDAYVAKLVEVFREVRNHLEDDGTLWLNLGDSYASSTTNNGGYSDKSTLAGFTRADTKGRIANESGSRRRIEHGAKPKDLLGIPWRVAFALQADGWYLRQDIIWHKPNPMPESVTDRCTKAHEYIFLLSKSARYYYDAKAIAEPATYAGRVLDYTGDQKNNLTDDVLQATRPKNRKITVADTRNRRSVWTVTTKPYSGAHFATFPPDLIEPCILAGCPEGGTVLDPFGGAGTTGLVADRHHRNALLIELNPEYAELARNRISDDAPLLSTLT